MRTDVVLYKESDYIDVQLADADCLMIVGCSLHDSVKGTAGLVKSYANVPRFYINPNPPPARYSGKLIHIEVEVDALAEIEFEKEKVEIDDSFWKNFLKRKFKKSYFTIRELWNKPPKERQGEIKMLSGTY